MRRSADKDLLISQRARAVGRSKNPEIQEVIRGLLNEKFLFHGGGVIAKILQIKIPVTKIQLSLQSRSSV